MNGIIVASVEVRRNQVHVCGSVLELIGGIAGPVCYVDLEYWHQRADERHGNPPPR